MAEAVGPERPGLISSRFGKTWAVRTPFMVALIAMVCALVAMVATVRSGAIYYAGTGASNLALGITFISIASAMFAAVATGDRATWIAPPRLSDERAIQGATRFVVVGAVWLLLGAFVLVAKALLG